MDFHPVLPEPIQLAQSLLTEAGHQCFLVGGAVRDFLLGQQPEDYDLCTPASVEQIEAIFARYKIINNNGKRHGTVTVRIQHTNIEISTFRYEKSEPISIETDLSHRDLTINAIAYDGATLIDPFHGVEDLRNGLLRMAPSPEDTIREDPLRLLRALRFHGKYGFAIEKETSEAINEFCPLLQSVAKERILSELRSILVADNIQEMMLDYAEVFSFLFPPLGPTRGFDQHNRWHAHELYVHIAHVVGATKPDFLTRLAAVLHDIGKVDSVSIEIREDGQIIYHFPKHPQRSAELAAPLLEQLLPPRNEREAILFLIQYHDTHIEPTSASVRRFLSRCDAVHGYDPLSTLARLLDLQQADHADHTILVPIPVKEILDIAEGITRGDQGFTLKNLAIDGEDVKRLGLRKKAVGSCLRYALEQVLDERVPNEKQALIRLIQETYLVEAAKKR